MPPNGCARPRRRPAAPAAASGSSKRPNYSLGCHCERSEAIPSRSSKSGGGLLRRFVPRNDSLSDPRRQPDRQARAGLDRAGNQIVAERLHRAVLDRALAMRQLLVAKREDRLFKRRVGVAEPFRLAAIMLVD